MKKLDLTLKQSLNLRQKKESKKLLKKNPHSKLRVNQRLNHRLKERPSYGETFRMTPVMFKLMFINKLILLLPKLPKSFEKLLLFQLFHL